MRGRRDAWEGGAFTELLDPSAKNSSTPRSREEVFQRKKREHSSLCVYLLLCSLLTQEKELFHFPSHLTWINWWGGSPWLLKRTLSYKMDFVSATLQVFIFFLFLHHSLPLVLLLNPSGFFPLFLSCLSAISDSLPSSCSSCCPLFFPLAILLIVFSTPSVTPPTLCLFFLWGLSSLHLDSLPFIHPTALISAFSPVCFCCSGLDTCGVTDKTSETTQSWGSKETNTGKRLGGGTDWSVCWHHAARPSSGSPTFPSLFCWKDGCPLYK